MVQMAPNAMATMPAENLTYPKSGAVVASVTQPVTIWAMAQLSAKKAAKETTLVNMDISVQLLAIAVASDTLLVIMHMAL